MDPILKSAISLFVDLELIRLEWIWNKSTQEGKVIQLFVGKSEIKMQFLIHTSSQKTKVLINLVDRHLDAMCSKIKIFYFVLREYKSLFL